MDTGKPELIIVSQNLLGGGTSFTNNLLASFPRDFFDIKCIYLDPVNWHGAKALDIKMEKDDVVFPYGSEPRKITSKRLSRLISNREGAIVSALEDELVCLDLYPRKNKTVYFVCHDAGFLPVAQKYQSLISVFIAHNITVFDELKKMLVGREKDIHFIEHGVKVPSFVKEYSTNRKLKIVFLARHHKFKGLFDLPVINDLLVEKGVEVEWMILGDGPERPEIIKRTEKYPNFQFKIPVTADDVLTILKDQDVFILPSRADGLPVALLESMSVGCVPVIANFSEGIKKVVSDDIGFVVPVGDNDAFAEKLAFLSNNRSAIKELSENCIRKIKEDFNVENQALKYYELFKQYKQLKTKSSLKITDLYRKAQYNDNLARVIRLANRFGISKKADKKR
ncbi:glycosyltransferase family 4 protein [Chitinophagaceae bacterium 26-R-25]|nr:glycosyltransferase family 4 protein [Chitinophagaceae bacterium 26-R-25]